MDGSYGGGQVFLNLSLLLTLFFVPSYASFWSELVHPKLRVSIQSSIPGGTVHVKCISNSNDIKEGDLAPPPDSPKRKPFTFVVELKLLHTVRYNCVLKQKDREIGQFLGFRSGSYCEKGCTWNLFPDYAQRCSSSVRQRLVNQTYKVIGSPDDDTYDFS